MFREFIISPIKSLLNPLSSKTAPTETVMPPVTLVVDTFDPKLALEVLETFISEYRQIRGIAHFNYLRRSAIKVERTFPS